MAAVEHSSDAARALAPKVDGLVVEEQPLLERRILFHPAKKSSSVVDLPPGIEPLNSPCEKGIGKRSWHEMATVGGVKPVAQEEDDIVLDWGAPLKIGAGLSNLGNTCFLNSVLQCLTYTPPLTNFLESGQHRATCRNSGFCALCALEGHVKNAIRSWGKVVAPNHLVKNLRCISRTFQPWRQEDAHEYLRYLLEALHKASLPDKLGKNSSHQERSLMYKIFGGRLRSRVQCTDCMHTSDTFDPFLDLSLEITHANSLPRALARFTAQEALDGGNKYHCGHCKKKVRALKRFTIDSAPNILTVQFKRFSSNGQHGRKIDKQVTFGRTLDIQPFMSNGKGGAIYELYGVLVHSGGSTHSGHYYCFIRTSADMWHVLDDTKVRQLSERTVMEQKAYILFYMRKASSSSLPAKPSSSAAGASSVSQTISRALTTPVTDKQASALLEKASALVKASEQASALLKPSEPAPAPSPLKPAPSPLKPAPSPSEPAPSPSPSPSEPASSPSEPAPSPSEPAPSPSEPAPSLSEPARSGPPSEAEVAEVKDEGSADFSACEQQQGQQPAVFEPERVDPVSVAPASTKIIPPVSVQVSDPGLSEERAGQQGIEHEVADVTPPSVAPEQDITTEAASNKRKLRYRERGSEKVESPDRLKSGKNKTWDSPKKCDRHYQKLLRAMPKSRRLLFTKALEVSQGDAAKRRKLNEGPKENGLAQGEQTKRRKISEGPAKENGILPKTNVLKPSECNGSAATSGSSVEENVKKPIPLASLASTQRSELFGVGVARWDGVEASGIDEFLRTEHKPTSSKRDEWDEEYDRGKVKKVRRGAAAGGRLTPCKSSGNENPFQALAHGRQQH